MRWLAVLVLVSRASADPIRLRADALATTASPAGLVMLSADGDDGPDLSAEAVVWTGAATVGDTSHADVLVIALRARTADGRATARLGRFVETLGALRPVQIDGAAGRLRLRYRIDAEAYGGIPVTLGARAWDWATGGRLSRRIADTGSLGIAYMQQRDDGRLAFEEVGVDAGAALGKRDDAGVRLAYDLANPGLAEATVSTSHRTAGLRLELFATYRAASHLLPATSLFSVIGDIPSARAGTTLTWHAAPRLDVISDVAVRHADDAFAPAIVLQGRLKLDDRGASLLAGELRRDGIAGDEWTGARGSARIALSPRITASTEVELVVPDRGGVWPWSLVAVAYAEGPWQAAIAGEALASPQYVHRVDLLVQLARRWGTP